MRLFKVKYDYFFAHYEHRDETVYLHKTAIVLAENEEEAIEKVMQKEKEREKVGYISVVESDVIYIDKE